MSAFDFFDKIYVINFPDGQRYEHIRNQLDTIRRTATYVWARQPEHSPQNMRRNPSAEFGCNLSHIKAVVRAIYDGAERPLFIEDDVIFEGAPHVEELPEHWDVLYLGGHPREKVERYSSHLVRVGKFSFAEAYSLSRTALIRFHDYWLDRIGKKPGMYDFILGEFASTGFGYCCYPVVTRQATMKSHISGDKDDKTGLLVRGWTANLA